MSPHDPLPGREDLDALLAGFDGATAPRPSRAVKLWRVGRWLRAQGAPRPRSLHAVRDDAIIVNGQILSIDRFGQIQNLSTLRRTTALACQGYYR
jgi:hypothetical protein